MRKREVERVRERETERDRDRELDREREIVREKEREGERECQYLHNFSKNPKVEKTLNLTNSKHTKSSACIIS